MILLLVVLALVVMVATHVVLQRRLVRDAEAQRLALVELEEARRKAHDDLEEARHRVLYKQQKASAATVARSDRAVRKLSDEVREALKNTRHLHGRVDDFFADSRIQRVLDKAETDG